MADEINRPDDEDEFHFSPDVSPDTNVYATTTTRTNTSRFGGLNRRNMLILVGSIIVLFALYKLLSMFWGVQQKTSDQVQQPSPPQVIVPETPVQTPTTPPVQSVTPVVPVQQPVVDDQTKQQMQTMQNQMSQLGNALTNLQSGMTAIQNQLGNLTTTIEHQQAEINALMTPKVIPKKVVVVEPRPVIIVPPPMPYYIHAMIPGRVWLIGADGSSLSVTFGDIVPGYGKIKTINPVRALVITNTGAIIRYRGE